MSVSKLLEGVLSPEDLSFYGMFLKAARQMFPIAELREWGKSEKCETAEIFRRLAKLGVPHYWIPKQYGGEEGSLREQALIALVLAQVAPFIHLSMSGGALGLSHAFATGSHQQLELLVPQLMDGSLYIAWATTSPGSGTAPFSPTSGGTIWRTIGGREVLSGGKQFITGGGTAGAIVVNAADGEGGCRSYLLTGERRALVVSESSGKKVALRSSETVALYFDDVPVTDEERLGEGGLAAVMNVLLRGRIFFGIGSVGVLLALLEELKSWMAIRKSDGKLLQEIDELTGMVDQIAKSAAALLKVFLKAIEAHEQEDSCAFRYLASLAKVAASKEGAYQAGNAGEIFGGIGVYPDSHRFGELMGSYLVARVGEGGNPKLISLLREWECKQPRLANYREELFSDIGLVRWW